MKKFLLLTATFLLLTAVPASAQEVEPTPQGVQGEGGMNETVLDVFTTGEGSVCSIELLNNISVYPDNLLSISSGGETELMPVERSAGEDLIVEFVAAGDEVTVSVLWVVGTSITEVPIGCSPPPPVTTTVAPPETTTTTPNESTSSTSEAPTTTPPPPELAITGTDSWFLAVFAIGIIAIGVWAVRESEK